MAPLLGQKTSLTSFSFGILDFNTQISKYIRYASSYVKVEVSGSQFV